MVGASRRIAVVHATALVATFVLATTLVAATPAATTPAAATPAVWSSGGDAAARPHVVAVYPNPIADEDAGEYVVLAVPNGTDLEGWTLDDGEDVVALPNRTVSGRIAASPDPAVARNLTDYPVVGVGHFSLANGGERIRLRYRNATVDAITYEDAPEGEVYRDGTWHHRLATDRAPVTVDARSVRAFVLPDDSGVPLDAIRSADRRILLGGYSFTTRRVADALLAAHRRGVEVRVLVDGGPVGGIPRRERRLLNSLVRAGIDVRAVGGERTPYAFHHAKYAVVDDRALVVTENWKAAGTGGRSSRGWGAVVRGEAVADELAGVFRADERPGRSIPWKRYRANASFTGGGRANGTFPHRFAPEQVPVEDVHVLVTPDNAEPELVGMLRDADRSIRIEQMSMERGPLLNATLAAARRGVRVRILLSSAWYVEDENRRLVEALNRRAAREGLDLEAKLVEPRSRFEKVHAKGAVIDGDRAVVGSLNWNDHSAARNREVVLVLDGERVAGYYERVFRADWHGGAWRIPAGVPLGLALLVAVAVGVARRRIRFDAGDGAPGDGAGADELPDSEIHGW